MNENEMKFVHGLLYKPHSQGVCEIVNKIIRISLTVKKLEDKNKFFISKALEDAINAYNNTIHIVTKHIKFLLVQI